jgi:flagellar hook-basal body complex protein FliE
MKITGLDNSPVLPSESGAKTSPVGESFGDTMKKAIANVNQLQTDADQMATKIASGDSVDIHNAMIAMQKASMSLQFTMQVRSKVMDAYQEIMKTQM